MSDAEFADLLVGIAAQRQRALARLYEELAPRVFGLLVALIPSRELAETVLVEVFVDVWDAARSFDPRVDRPTMWVLAIARRRAVACLRGRRPPTGFAEILCGMRAHDVLEGRSPRDRSGVDESR